MHIKLYIKFEQRRVSYSNKFNVSYYSIRCSVLSYSILFDYYSIPRLSIILFILYSSDSILLIPIDSIRFESILFCRILYDVTLGCQLHTYMGTITFWKGQRVSGSVCRLKSYLLFRPATLFMTVCSGKSPNTVGVVA